MNEELENETPAEPQTRAEKEAAEFAAALELYKSKTSGGVLMSTNELLGEDFATLSREDFLKDLERGGSKIIAAPEAWRDNPEFMLKAYRIKPAVLAVLGPNLKKSEEFFYQVAGIDGKGVPYGDPTIQTNQKIIAKAAENWPEVLAHTPLRENYNFVAELAATNPKVLPYIPPEIAQKLKGATEQ